MSLQQHLPDGTLRLRWVQPTSIGVGDQTLQRSFLLSPQQLIEDWPPHSIAELSLTDLTPLFALSAQVLILGTGSRQRFLPAALLGPLLQRGIGVECMDNGAAARTFNLLADEGRAVVGGFLLPGD